MPVTAKLSKRFYERFRDEIANELATGHLARPGLPIAHHQGVGVTRKDTPPSSCPQSTTSDNDSRRAYGLRDPDYLRLKVLTCRLPEL